MSDEDLSLRHPPIVEAVLDIDCDMPPGQEIASLEIPARDAFRDLYPKLRTQLLQEYRIEQPADGPPQHSSQQGIQGFQFLQEDEKQIVQVRAQGFSFNRLAPYTGLDDYLPEIEWAWRVFISIASPLQIRLIRLRYINRILLPMVDEQVDLDEYLKTGPRLPDEERLIFTGFLDQHSAVESGTGNQVNIIIASQAAEHDRFPIVLDIGAFHEEAAEPDNWERLLEQIQLLRGLKNRVFKNMLTERCLELFR